MDANRYRPIDFEGPELMRVWCILAGLALAPLPALHALPAEFLYFVFEQPSPNWNGLALNDWFWLSVVAIPLIPIFLAWSLPGADRPGLSEFHSQSFSTNQIPGFTRILGAPSG